MSKKNQNKNNSSSHPNNTLQQQFVAAQFSGPIPPPDILAKYNDILPGLADRIMKQAEAKTIHRIELENKVIQSDIINSRLGLVFDLQLE